MEPMELFTKTAEQINSEITFSNNKTESNIMILLPEGRKQNVRLSLVNHQFRFLGSQQTMIHVDSLVGPMNNTVDPEYLIECMRKLVMARICILDNELNLIALEGRLPLELTTPEILAHLVLEAASCADSLEQLLFDVDIY